MGTTREPLRVLVIDDDTALSEAILDALGARGIFAWSVRPTASSPPASVARTAATFRPDVVLLDIVMPIDTARLLTVLRGTPELSHAVFLGCSGHAALADDIAAKLDGFLHKPFDTTELLQAVTEAATLRRPAARRTRPRRVKARAR